MNHDYGLILEIRRTGDSPLGTFPLFRNVGKNIPAAALPDLVDAFLERLKEPDTQKELAVMLANYARAKNEDDVFRFEQLRMAESTLPGEKR